MMTSENQNHQIQTLPKNFALGLGLSSATRLISTPFQRTITLMNPGPEPEIAKKDFYSKTPTQRALTVIRHHRQSEGSYSFLWRGLFMDCLLYAPYQAGAVALNEYIAKNLDQYSSSSFSYERSFQTKFLVGGSSGVLSMFLFYGLDNAQRERLRLRTTSLGLHSCYKNVVGMIAPTFISRGLTLGGFAHLQQYYHNHHPIMNVNEKNPNGSGSLPSFFLSSFFFAYFAHSLSIPFSYSIDTVRRRVRLDRENAANPNNNNAKYGNQNRRYKGYFDCAKEIAKNEGIISFWKGMSSSYMRYPGVSIAFILAGFECFKYN